METRPNQHVTTHDAIARGHEGTEVSMRGIVLAVIGLAIAGLVGMVVSWFTMVGVERANERADPPRSPMANQTPPPAQPWLQPSPPQGGPGKQPREDMEEYRKREVERLSAYRVVDANAGIVQIPIDRAMLILAAPPTTRPATVPGQFERKQENREPTGGQR